MPLRRTDFGYSLRIDRDGDIGRAVRLLAAFEKEFPQKVDKILLREANAAAKRAQAAIVRAPTGSSRRRTRQRIARGVGVRRSRKGGYRITTKMPAGEEMLPRGFASQWFHPVFGTPITVLQSVHYDWLVGPAGEGKDSATRKIIGELEDGADRIARLT